MWKLNNPVLNNPWVKEGIKRDIRKYFEINEHENTTYQMCDRKIHCHLGIGNMRGITKGHEKNFRGDGYIHCLDLVMLSWVYTYVKTSNCTL